MCGFVGFSSFRFDHFTDPELVAAHMGTAIAHRGPDSAGSWSDSSLGISLAHQRLSVLDLSSLGNQPMHSFRRRYAIAFNGEIYNHLSLRRELEADGSAPPWSGHSDTETLLAAIEAWGLEAALPRFRGMWAFALVDRELRRLHLVRDRFGEKPLYWGFTGSGSNRALVFGSELSALRSYPHFNNTIDRWSLAEYLSLGHVPAPLSIYSGISKLLPGHLVSIPLSLNTTKTLPPSRCWWRLGDVISKGYANQFATECEALDSLEETLGHVISEQAFADVPLGSFLSGGVDSSLITALLQKNTSQSLYTFTVGFEEEAFNEAPYARAVAEHLGTEHNEIFLTSSDVLALIPHLPQIYSEPFSDSSQLPTHLLCREARRSGLTVALSGDGGDELFGGYNRYLWTHRYWSSLALVPAPWRRALGRCISRIPPATLDPLASVFPAIHIGNKAHKVSSLLIHANNIDETYKILRTVWSTPSSLLQDHVMDFTEAPAESGYLQIPCLAAHPAAQMMAKDASSYLSDDILVKIDRAAMSVGLETRAPFLDHRVTALAWRLPMSMKIRSGSSKWALRQILYKHVPQHLLERPKAGFAIPISTWLRGVLRPWAEELLHPDRLYQEGYLRPEPIQQIWHQHLSGSHDHSSKLWSVLMWQSWLEKWG